MEAQEDCVYDKINEAGMDEDNWCDMDDAHKRDEKKRSITYQGRWNVLKSGEVQ